MTNCARQKRVRGQLVRVSRSRRAGLVFSVGRLHRSLRHVTPFRIVSEGAAVYLAAVLEYLCAEVLILANAIARHHRTARITPRQTPRPAAVAAELLNLVPRYLRFDTPAGPGSRQTD